MKMRKNNSGTVLIQNNIFLTLIAKIFNGGSFSKSLTKNV